MIQINEVNLAQAMRNAGELHNARVSRRQQRKQSARQREVGQIVCAELQLEPVRRHLAFRRSQDRKSVEEGKSVSVRVDLGGHRIITKKKIQKKYDRSRKQKKIKNK